MNENVEFLDIRVFPNGVGRTVVSYNDRFLTMADGKELGYPPILMGYRPKSLEDAQKVFNKIQGILDDFHTKEDEALLRMAESSGMMENVQWDE